MRYRPYDYDNRDAAQMYEYMEARIEALKQRIQHLETENKTIRWKELAGRIQIPALLLGS